jgi:hypothetical protein
VPVHIGGTLANPSATPDLAQGVLDTPKNVLGTVGKGGGGLLNRITGGQIGGSSSGGGASGCTTAAAKSNSPVDRVKKLFK